MAFDFFKQYEIAWFKSAEKQLSKLSKIDQLKIIESIDALRTNPASLDLKKMTGFKHLYRLRVGNYRIILQVKKSKKLTVVSYIGHRKDVYSAFKRLSIFSTHH